LLQKSIIRVEEDDVDIDDNMDENDHDEVMTSAEALGGMSLNDTDQNAGNSAIPPNGKISITFEKFEEIKLMLAHKLRLVQQSSDEGNQGRNVSGYHYTNISGLHRSWHAS
jgi:DNA replication licensing factor MCM6